MKIDDTPVHVGTSGYKFDDWTKNFYPSGTENERFLSYYVSQGLNFLELNFTFYTVPTREDIERILENCKGKLKFSVKLHKTFLRGKTEYAHEFKEGLKPLVEAGLVKGYLADYLVDFKASIENMDKMEELRDIFSDAPLYAQLLHRSWYREKYLEDLHSRELGVCITNKKDIPYKPVVSPGPTLYFRMFGKTDKLDYNFSPREMKTVADDIKKLSFVCRDVFVSFCNVAKANAAKNARQFMTMAGE